MDVAERLRERGDVKGRLVDQLRLRLAPAQAGRDRSLPLVAKRRVAPVEVSRVEDERAPMLLQPVDRRGGDGRLSVQRDRHSRGWRQRGWRATGVAGARGGVGGPQRRRRRAPSVERRSHPEGDLHRHRSWALDHAQGSSMAGESRAKCVSDHHNITSIYLTLISANHILVYVHIDISS